MAELISYWVVPGRLMAGSYPGSIDAETATQKLRSIVGAGVRSFIDLTEAEEPTFLCPLRPYENDLREVGREIAVSVAYSRFPIRDLGVPSRGLVVSILDALDAALGNGVPAYVDCLGGRGRTGVAIGCYLVRHAERLLGTVDGGVAGSLALERITELRRSQQVPVPEYSPQTQAQREMVLGWRPGL